MSVVDREVFKDIPNIISDSFCNFVVMAKYDDRDKLIKLYMPNFEDCVAGTSIREDGVTTAYMLPYDNPGLLPQVGACITLTNLSEIEYTIQSVKTLSIIEKCKLMWELRLTAS